MPDIVGAEIISAPTMQKVHKNSAKTPLLPRTYINRAMPLRWLVILHVLGATIWVGGHLILAIRYLPKALKAKDITPIVNFEQHYEALGIPALFLQIITGIWMASVYQIKWFSFETVQYSIINIKLILLITTLLLALHVRIFILPELSPKKLPLLVLHIVLVTVIAVAMLYLGLSFRLGLS